MGCVLACGDDHAQLAADPGAGVCSRVRALARAHASSGAQSLAPLLAPRRGVLSAAARGAEMAPPRREDVVVRRRLIAALVCFVLPAAAEAQIAKTGFTGFVTGFIGPSLGGDINDAGWTPGAAIAIVDPNGLGVEIDVSHVRTFNAPRFVESGITTLTVNVAGVWTDETAFIRPYVSGGGGLLRARA